MSSLIPKIKIGVDAHRGKFDVSAMTHTTSEIGYVQPTYSKMLIPKSNLRIQTQTGSRLSPLFVPTMGRIDIRHYHCYVPFSTLWTPFDAFLTKTNYTLPDGSTYIPQSMPYFTVGWILYQFFGRTSQFVNTVYTQSLNTHDVLTCGIYLNGSLINDAAYQNLLTDAGNVNKLTNIISQSSLGYVAGLYYSSDNHFYGSSISNDTNLKVTLSDLASASGSFDFNDMYKTVSYPTLAHCDFSEQVDINGNVYTFCYNFNGKYKRLRSIFMGLGYSFNPFDFTQVTPFKLLAFYKSYWALFGVNRTYNFFNTYCYKLIKHLSDTNVLHILNYDTSRELFFNFVNVELGNCTYKTPADYFSASDTTIYRSTLQSGGFKFISENGFTKIDYPTSGAYCNAAVQDQASGPRPSPVMTTTDGTGQSQYSNPLAQKIALRLLRFVNKNSVVGRKVSDILRVRYGVSDVHNLTHESVERVGGSSTPINISAVYNNTDSGEMPLGSYAGLGVSGREGATSKRFNLQTKEFGIFLTMTAVVPRMGYFQGMFRENSDGLNGSFDFYTPEFDAQAYQNVRYNELIADRQFKDTQNGSVGTNLGNFGVMPVYSHLKVGFNRCLGDISLPSKQESMLPYTLDRFFPQRKMINDGKSYVSEVLPINEPNDFRSATKGETNRIFTDVSPTDDHVIMQIYFDMKLDAPMRSISTSFDTFDEDSTHSVDVAHE